MKINLQRTIACRYFGMGILVAADTMITQPRISQLISVNGNSPSTALYATITPSVSLQAYTKSRDDGVHNKKVFNKTFNNVDLIHF
jgi:hypothetical protein